MLTCVGWQVTLCDPIWQVTSSNSEMGFPRRAISAFTFYIYLFALLLAFYTTQIINVPRNLLYVHSRQIERAKAVRRRRHAAAAAIFVTPPPVITDRRAAAPPPTVCRRRAGRGREVRPSEDELDSKTRRAGLENRPGGVQRH